MTTSDELMRKLRAADEDDVGRALADSHVEPLVLPAVDLLEFFNRMLDVLAGPDES